MWLGWLALLAWTALLYMGLRKISGAHRKGLHGRKLQSELDSHTHKNFNPWRTRD